MYPYFEFFGRTITTYFLMALVGMFVAGIFACALARKRGYDDNDVIVVLLFSAIGVLLGGHLLYGLTNWKLIPLLFTAESFSQFIEFAGAIFGGSVFYGGLFGAIIAASITIRVKKLDYTVYADMLAPAIPLFHCFARIGCFLGGCCYGIESSIGFTATGNTLVPTLNDVCRFPVQLLEAGLNLVLFLILYWLYRKSLTCRPLQGKLLLCYLMSYSVIRFFDEFLRGDAIRGFVLGMSTSQFISILLFLVSGIVLTVLICRERARRCSAK